MAIRWLNSTRPDRSLRQRTAHIALFAVLLVAPHPGLADRNSDLAQLRQRLEKLQNELAETRGDRDEARDRLREVERRIGTGMRRIRLVDRQISTEQQRLRTLEVRRRDQKAQLQALRSQLGRIVRASYEQGQQDGLKLLLSQDDPARLGRQLVYYRYMAESRTTKVGQLEQQIARLDALESEVRDRQKQLTELRHQQQHEHDGLTAARGERRAALARLNNEVRNRTREIERLRQDQARLSRLVRDLDMTLRDQPPPVSGQNNRQPGKWRLPVTGRLVARFGQPRDVGDMRWRGVFIAAREGQPVRAINGGRIVFADWLRGFGLIVVVDHGKGLMSLYGHNQSLYKSVGDSVEAGETVAVSGNTGGPPQPGVYFEIRERGQPRNPLDWCKL